jgi:hypothetical protein
MARPKGVPNKATKAREEILSRGGLMPLGHLLEVMRDEGETPERRMAAAIAAAPYCHPRLTAVDLRAYQEIHETRRIEVVQADALPARTVEMLRAAVRGEVARVEAANDAEGEG